MNESVSPEVSKQKLAADLKAVIADAEELLRVTAGQAGDKVTELRGKIEKRLSTARATLSDAQDAMLDKAKQAGRATDDYVHDHPWKAVGVAAGIGLLLGLLISRR